MAESTLSLKYEELRSEVSRFLGWDTTYDNLSAGEKATLDMIIESGLRQFYYPPIPHRWSFFTPAATMATTVPYGTGTVAITKGATTVTLSDGTFPSWAAQGTLVISSRSYAIASRTDGTHVELSSNWPETTVTAANYSLQRRAYDLPDDFGAIIGQINFDAGEGAYTPIQIIGEGQVRERLQYSTSTGRPRYAALRPTAFTTGTGQRFEILFYPMADAVYDLVYRYNVLPDALSSVTDYPLGGMAHAETILESCLAIAEQRMNDESGIHSQKFLAALAASVIRDQKAIAPEYLGYNRDGSMGRDPTSPGRRVNYVTYDGVLY